MTDKIDDGGPAFPISLTCSPSGDVYHSGQAFWRGEGMSLRVYIATAVLQGLLAYEGQHHEGDEHHHTKTALQYADALIIELRKEPK